MQEELCLQKVNYWILRPIYRWCRACHIAFDVFEIFNKVARDAGLVKADEPRGTLTQGMVLKAELRCQSPWKYCKSREIRESTGRILECLFCCGSSERDLEWSDQGVEGCYRFLQRVNRLVGYYPIN